MVKNNIMFYALMPIIITWVLLASRRLDTSWKLWLYLSLFIDQYSDIDVQRHTSKVIKHYHSIIVGRYLSITTLQLDI